MNSMASWGYPHAGGMPELWQAVLGPLRALGFRGFRIEGFRALSPKPQTLIEGFRALNPKPQTLIEGFRAPSPKPQILIEGFRA